MKGFVSYMWLSLAQQKQPSHGSLTLKTQPAKLSNCLLSLRISSTVRIRAIPWCVSPHGPARIILIVLYLTRR